jgi:uncharacterized membrane protein
VARDSRTFEVDKPVQEVYQRWLNYENLAEFAPQIKEVRQTGKNRSHWVAEALGVRAEWEAEVTERLENRRIAWRSVSGFDNEGEVLFEPIDAHRTRVTVNFEYTPFSRGEEGTLAEQIDEAAETAQETLEHSTAPRM